MFVLVFKFFIWIHRGCADLAFQPLFKSYAKLLLSIPGERLLAVRFCSRHSLLFQFLRDPPLEGIFVLFRSICHITYHRFCWIFSSSAFFSCSLLSNMFFRHNWSYQRLIFPTGIWFDTINRWCGEDCWIDFSKAWFQVVLFKPLWCVRQTEDDSFPYSFRKMYFYRKPGSEIRKPCSRYALLPEAWFGDLIS